MTPSDYDITKAMLMFGGSFLRKLAAAYCAADPINQDKLKAAFPEYWAEFREIAIQQAQQVSNR